MIDFRNQKLLQLSVAAREWPGGGVHVSTLHRYRLQGVRGIRLECVRVGGRWCTSCQAIDRFIAGLNSDSSEPMSAKTVLAGLTAAEKELDRDGF